MPATMTVPDPWAANTEDLRSLIPSIEVHINAEEGNTATLAFTPAGTSPTGNVRRPLNGISVKPNTYAYITVVQSDGTFLKVFNDLGSTVPPPSDPVTLLKREAEDTSKPKSRYWTDWFLTNVSETRQEKIQIVETFGDTVLHLFGERPRVLQFTGFLMNSQDFNWRAQFWENYDRFFRATKLVEKDARVFIGFDDILVSGYPINATARQSANDPHKIQFSFSFLVSTYNNTYMQNLGTLQALQSGITSSRDGNGVPVYATRASEFLTSGAFKDKAFELGTQEVGPLSEAIGGDRLEALNAMREFQDSLRIGDFDTYSLLFDPRLRYIKGAKTAIETVLAAQRAEINRLAYQGVEALAANTRGGVQGLNYWFGLVGHMYRVVAINAVRMVGGRTDASQNRWLGLIDTVSQLGNPYALASYMGYLADVAQTSALAGTTDKYSLNNLENTFGQGLVARGQSSNFGTAVDNRNTAVSVQDSAALSSVPSLSSNFLSRVNSVERPGYEPPVGLNGSETDAQAQTLNQLNVATAVDREQQERNAVELQQRRSQRNHGALFVLDSELELNEDGN